MPENKTKPTDASVDHYLAAIENDVRRQDCVVLAKMMSKATGQNAIMWGTSIVGFGIHAYKYESGREGETCVVGFSSRKGDISIYLTGGFPAHEELLSRLGKHKMGKGCLYVGKLKDVDLQVLEELITASFKSKAA